MTDHAPPRLEPHPATLNAPTQREPHVDSEEAVQLERHRIARELDSIQYLDISRQSSEAPSTIFSYASLRSRNASLQEPANSHESLRSSTSTPHWYDSITRFWNTHISITIEEGAHRDHLGTLVRACAFSRQCLTSASS
jgi:hypothetical protein